MDINGIVVGSIIVILSTIAFALVIIGAYIIFNQSRYGWGPQPPPDPPPALKYVKPITEKE